MQLLVVRDPVPVEPARPGVDPREHDGIGFDRIERMFAQFASLDHHPFFGLAPNQPKILPSGDRQQQQRHGKGRGKKPAQGPSRSALRASLDRLRPASAAAGQSAEKTGGQRRLISVGGHGRRSTAPTDMPPRRPASHAHPQKLAPRSSGCVTARHGDGAARPDRQLHVAPLLPSSPEFKHKLRRGRTPPS